MSISARASRLHRALAWFSLCLLAAWVLSGLTHPLMSLLGPKAVQMRAPVLEFEAAQLAEGLGALEAFRGQARVLRTVPTPGGVAWQATDATDLPRRYLGLGGEAVPQDDRALAEWLMRHYTGATEAVAEAELLTDFDADYPWVNRLLPVWRLRLDRPDGLTAYIHTETGAMTTLGDARRRVLQRVFRTVHTLDPLRGMEPVRLALIGAAMAVLLAAALAGVLMWALRRPVASASPARRWHRRLALWVALPLLLMASTGLVHLIATAGEAPPRGLALPEALPALGLPDGLPLAPDTPLRAAGVVMGPESRPVLWVTPVSGPPRQFSVDPSGRWNEIDIEALAQAVAARWAPAGADAPVKLTHFSPDYDFRNRRLPAWQVRDADGAWISVDHATGQRLDRVGAARRVEGWVFSVGHKWQPLSHWVGPAWRDLVQALLLLLGVAVGVLGIRLRRRRATASAAPRPESAPDRSERATEGMSR